jgi:hypothetical protein
MEIAMVSAVSKDAGEGEPSLADEIARRPQIVAERSPERRSV